MVQKVAPFTVKLLRKPWFPPFSTSLFQAFRSRGDSAKRCEKKKKRGVGSLFSFLFFSLFSFVPHPTIRTPGTSYFSTNSHRNACYTGYKKRKFWETGNGYTCKMFYPKIGFHLTIMYCENNRENSQSKLVIQENNHHINLSQLQVLEGNQCIPYPLQNSLQNYKKKTKVHFVLIHSTKSTFFCCNQCFMACLSI